MAPILRFVYRGIGAFVLGTKEDLSVKISFFQAQSKLWAACFMLTGFFPKVVKYIAVGLGNQCPTRSPGNMGCIFHI